MVPSSPHRPCNAMNAISTASSRSSFYHMPVPSIGTAWYPLLCKLWRTALPERREISLSEESPPSGPRSFSV